MSKMREAHKAWTNGYIRTEQEAFEAGWQAAIAAVKGGGPVAWRDDNFDIDNVIHQRPRPNVIGDWHPLYELPEDV